MLSECVYKNSTMYIIYKSHPHFHCARQALNKHEGENKSCLNKLCFKIRDNNMRLIQKVRIDSF